MDERCERILQEILAEEPILEYAFPDPQTIGFSDRIRWVCEHECPRYGTSWSCPPAVGSVQACAARCRAHEGAFIFSTVAEVQDITNLEETLATRMAHEEVTARITERFRREYGKARVLTLSTESCSLCSRCTWPDAPCRHPDKMFPCVESYGIVVSELAEAEGMSFDNGPNVVTWFSLIFFGGEETGASGDTGTAASGRKETAASGR